MLLTFWTEFQVTITFGCMKTQTGYHFSMIHCSAVQVEADQVVTPAITPSTPQEKVSRLYLFLTVSKCLSTDQRCVWYIRTTYFSLWEREAIFWEFGYSKIIKSLWLQKWYYKHLEFLLWSFDINLFLVKFWWFCMPTAFSDILYHLGEIVSMLNLIVKRPNCFKIAYPTYDLLCTECACPTCLLFEPRFFEASCFLFMGA